MTSPILSEAAHREYTDEMTGVTGLATADDAHREWHRNTGVPMGQSGCPQDACDGDDFYVDEAALHILCGHCGNLHCTVADVRECAVKQYTGGQLKRCDRCGRYRDDVELDPNPYDLAVNGVEIKEALCNSCFHDLKLAI
jgi:hypothetical protein